MLPLKDRTRRTLAILAFLILGLGPIFVLAYLGVERRLPGYVRQEEVRLTQLLGVTTSIESIEHPRPGETVYCDLVLSDPETDATILTIPSIEIVHRSETSISIPESPPLGELIEQLLSSEVENRSYLIDANDGAESEIESAKSGGVKTGSLQQWTVQVDKLTFHQGALRNIPGVVERLFTKRASQADAVIDFQIGIVEFDSPSQFGMLDQSRSHISKMSGRFLSLPESSQVDLSFTYDAAHNTAENVVDSSPSGENSNEDEIEGEEAIRVAVRRFHGPALPKTLVRVSSRSEFVPLSLISLFVDDPQYPVGRTAFQGELIVESSQEGWNGAVLGTLEDLDLAYKPEGYNSWAVTASSVRLMLAARFESNRIAVASGWIDMPQGSLGRDLAGAWSEAFAVPFSLPTDDGRGTVAFQQFRIQFDINGPILLCSPWAADGVIAMGRYGPLLGTKYAMRPVPIRSFLGAMTPQTEDGIVYSPWVARLECLLPNTDPTPTDESDE
jgi:hypothetical protein